MGLIRSGPTTQKPAVAMEADAKKVDADVADSNHHQTSRGHQRWLAALPAPHQSGVEVGRVHEPSDEGPCFFRIPTPPGPPGFIGPNSSADESNGKKQEANCDRAITQTVQLLARAKKRALKGGAISASRSQLGLAKAARTNRAAAQL